MVRSRRVHPAVLLAALAPWLAPGAAGAVTESEAIRVFLEQSPQARLAPVIEESVHAAFRVDTRVANPQVAFQVEDAADVRDEFLTLQQEIPLTGRRGLLDDRAAAAASAARLAAESHVRDDLYELKRTFYEVMYRERILQSLRDGDQLLARTVEILERREKEGEGAGYDVLRAQQDLTALRMTTVEARAALAVARARFGSFFDPASGMESATLVGDLGTSGPAPDARQAMDDAVEQRLDLRSLRAKREGLDLESRAARRRRFPDPVLTAGWKRTEAPGLSDTGYIAALTVPLPIFDRGSLDFARATAEGERIDLDAEILTRRIRAEVESAVARERAARETAERYGQDVELRASELHRIAQLKYDEGESGILELLDAHRTSLAMQLRALEVRYEAKVAEIDRNRIIGNEVKP